MHSCLPGASYTPRLGGLEPMNRCYRRGRLRLGGMAGIFCHLLMAGIVAGQHQGEQHAWAADFPARQGLISLCVDATNENKTVLPKYRYSMQTLDFALLEMNKTPVRSRPVVRNEACNRLLTINTFWRLAMCAYTTQAAAAAAATVVLIDSNKN